MDDGDVSLFRLWCGLGGLYYYPRAGRTAALEQFLDRCAAHGVATLCPYFGYAHYSPTVFRLECSPDGLATFDLYPGTDPFCGLIEGAHSRGIRVLGYTSPDHHGALMPNQHSPLNERLPFLLLSEVAHRHHEWWSVDSVGECCLDRDGTVLLDLASPECRGYLAADLARLVRHQRMDGLELEWLCGEGHCSPYESQSHEGAAAVTAFVRQVRRELDASAELSVAVEADLDRARAWRFDWPSWTAEGLVDTVVLRGLGDDPQVAGRWVRRARAHCGDLVTLVAQLDCWRHTAFREPETLLRAARAAREAGADRIGIYRADAVEAHQLGSTLAGLAATLREQY